MKKDNYILSQLQNIYKGLNIKAVSVHKINSTLTAFFVSIDNTQFVYVFDTNTYNLIKSNDYTQKIDINLLKDYLKNLYNQKTYSILHNIKRKQFFYDLLSYMLNVVVHKVIQKDKYVFEIHTFDFVMQIDVENKIVDINFKNGYDLYKADDVFRFRLLHKDLKSTILYVFEELCNKFYK